MAEVDLERVEPGIRSLACALDVVGRDARDVGLGRRTDHLHRQRARHPPGADRLDPVGTAVRHRAGVPDLPDRGSAFGMDRVGQPPQARHVVP
jgi:hypothetical protein